MKVNNYKRNSPEYPQILRDIPSAPKELFWLGAPAANWVDKPKVAIVGSRKISAYGRQVTAQLASELASAGVVIISGLAFGVDAAAHQAALDAGGTTIAVMPGGVEQIYPTSHTNLARQILRGGGALISEYPSGTPAFKQNFIARNRIVSGLADALLITEAAAASGSLHTARFALDQGKTVMAVPGNINSPGSEGCNNLIKTGATPVTSADDVFFALKLQPGPKKDFRAFRGTPEEEAVLELIRAGLQDQEEIASQAALDGPAMSTTLTILEIGGYIKAAGAGNWVAI